LHPGRLTTAVVDDSFRKEIQAMPPFSSRAATAQDLRIGDLPEPVREFEFSDADFRGLAKVAYDRAGIALADSKRNLVYTRLSRRLRALGYSSFRQYREYLDGEDGEAEMERFINSISTNHTKFFREIHHFDHLRSHVAAPFMQAGRGSAGRLRIWSAGCSTGEEPHTIAAVLRREIPEAARYDVKILATDIDTDVLAKASAGEYPASSIDDVPANYRSYFPLKDGDPTRVAIADEVRSLITFRRLNLIEPWPFRGPFDAVFCRNVMIYFDNPTKTSLVDRYARMLRPGGWLYLGHSETLMGPHSTLRLVGRTIYRREA
jgi:chemotaxis protein methyltransferase CheR